MKIAIMCNGLSSKPSDRTELIHLLNQMGHEVFVGAVYDGEGWSHRRDGSSSQCKVRHERGGDASWDGGHDNCRIELLG